MMCPKGKSPYLEMLFYVYMVFFPLIGSPVFQACLDPIN